jgi:quinolinate synthase
MKKTTLSDVLQALETLEPRIQVPEAVRIRALGAVEMMLRISS